MKKNYYEILEIDDEASQEVIEKVFKVLAKKYHPDLRQDGTKQDAQEKFKEINEAYQTLSDPQKRAEYDKELKIQKINEEQEKNILKAQNEQLKNIIKNNQRENSKNTNSNVQRYVRQEPKVKEQESYEQPRTNTQNQNYYTEQQRPIYYYQPPPVYYYRPKTFAEKLKDKLKGLFTIIIIILVLIGIAQIPVVKEYLRNVYETNPAIKVIVDIFSSIFKK